MQSCRGGGQGDSQLTAPFHQHHHQHQQQLGGRPASPLPPPTPPSAALGQRMCYGEPVKTPGCVDATLHVPVPRLGFGQSTPSVASAAAPRTGASASTYFTDERLAEMMRSLQQSTKLSATPVLQEYRSSSTPTLTSSVEAGLASLKLFSTLSGNIPQVSSPLPDQGGPTTQKVTPQESTQLLQRIANLEARVADLEADSGCHNGVFVMKLESFTQRLLVEAREGKTTVIYSQSFYTHPQGYKFCLRVHPNGTAQHLPPTGSGQTSPGGAGCFLSLFIHLMRGDYDDVLDWPFRGRIVLSILDVSQSTSGSGTVQSAGSAGRPASGAAARKRKDISAVVDETDPSLEAFTRPITPRNRRGFGYTDFASLDELLGSGPASRTGSDVRVPSSPYLVNDTLYIRATVQPLN